MGTELVGQLPDENIKNLNYLLDFLSSVAEQAETNMMGAENCAMVFAPSLIRKQQIKDDAVDPAAMMRQAQLMMKEMESQKAVIELLITGFDKIFPEGRHIP